MVEKIPHGVVRYFTAALALLLLVLLCPGSAGAAAGERHALIIGNSAYETLRPLRNPSSDARLTGDALRDLDFHVEILIDADKATMEQALAAHSERARDAEISLVYFAGHGVQFEGVNYLLTTDSALAAMGDPESTAIDVSRVVQAVQASDPTVGVIILDACRDNPLPPEIAPAGYAGGTALTSGLARLDGVSGLLIAYATAPGQIAYDGSGANSPFAAALVQSLEQPGLEIGLMFRDVRRRVMEMTAGAQIPWVEEALVSPLYLNPIEEPVVAEAEDPAAPAETVEERRDRIQIATTPPAPGQEELDWLLLAALDEERRPLGAEAYLKIHPQGAHRAAVEEMARTTRGLVIAEGEARPEDEYKLWTLVSRTGDPALLERFLALYPEGDFVEDARLRIATLTDTAQATQDAAIDDPAPPRNPVTQEAALDVFLGTGMTTFSLRQRPTTVTFTSLPQNGVLTVTNMDGTETALTPDALGEPVTITALAYRPAQGVLEARDRFTLGAVETGRGLLVQAAEPETISYTVEARVRPHDCDLLAGARFDPQGVVIGNYPNEIVPALAVPACEAAVAEFPEEPRFKFQLARALTAAERHGEALDLYIQAAEEGHVTALYALGAAYEFGLGVERDIDAAVGFYREGAEKGDLYAANSMGRIFQNGVLGEPDMEAALNWFLKAARGGHTFSYNHLGTMYLEGNGVPVDHEKAYRLFDASANAGDIYGFNNMGLMYDNGYFVQQDPEAARHWYERAARGGQPQAPINLALMYLGDHGLEPDEAEAAFWFGEAARLGNPWGYANLGWAHENGRGVAADPVKAAEFYARAAGFPGTDAAAYAERGFEGLPRAATVRALQERLAALDYEVGEPDGDWGPNTEQAARAFLADAGGQAEGTPVDILSTLTLALTPPEPCIATRGLTIAGRTPETDCAI
ncbi:caspase family protein [Inquilinus sp. CAU 1745]|uniref:caspase family protein n=1 Tax=Inquilinus sp. CAU 1745 TaxID=3140369 RepID=UPI00325AB4DE